MKIESKVGIQKKLQDFNQLNISDPILQSSLIKLDKLKSNDIDVYSIKQKFEKSMILNC